MAAQAKYRDNLPHVNTNELFLSDIGILTMCLFDKGYKLDELTFMKLLREEEPTQYLYDFYKKCAEIVVLEHDTGFLFEHCANWKMSLDMAVNKLGMTRDEWVALIKKSINQIAQVRDEIEAEAKKQGKTPKPMVLGTYMGPREGGYKLTIKMTPEEAEAYHLEHIKVLAEETPIDYITAYTLADPNEAIGFVRAAQKCKLPIAVSLTVEKGSLKLQSGHTVKEAIEIIEEATDKAPIYYGINCSHPSWFQHFFDLDEPWVKRIKQIKGNGSKKSHAELDECDTVDNGDPVEFGKIMANIRSKNNGNVNILCGCCGTTYEHISQVAKNVCGK